MISYMSAQREHIKCASGSVVEHHLAKVGAAGSSPVSRFFTGDVSSPVFCVVRPAAHVSNWYKSEIRPVVGRI